MIYPEVQKLTKTELALLVEQYKKNNFINSEKHESENIDAEYIPSKNSQNMHIVCRWNQ